MRETKRLRHEDSFLKRLMEKRILDVILGDGPLLMDSIGKNKTECIVLNNWTEGHIDIKTGLLKEALSNEPGFAAFNSAIDETLCMKDPLASHNI